MTLCKHPQCNNTTKRRIKDFECSECWEKRIANKTIADNKRSTSMLEFYKHDMTKANRTNLFFGNLFFYGYIALLIGILIIN